MPSTLSVSQGLGASFLITIRDSSGSAFTGYDGTETLTATMRLGRDTPALVTLTPAWVVAAQGTISLDFAAADTATVEPGRYLLQLKLADDSADLFEAFVDLGYSPGTASTLTSYGSYEDMIDVAPWLSKLQTNTDLARFARQRFKARKWFEDLLHRHYRGASGLLTDFYFVPGISFGGRFGEAVYYRDGRKSSDLQGWLDADRLDVTQQVIDAVTYHAIAQVCERQVSPGKEDSSYGALSRTFYARAEDAAIHITAEIDTNGDGTNDTIIRLGLTDTLEG